MSTSSRVVRTVILVAWSLSLFACSEQDFVVSVDRPLRVLHLSPADGATAVSLHLPVTVSFSEAVVPESLTVEDAFFVENVTDPENPSRVAGSIAYDEETRTAMFTPDAPWGYSSTYSISLTTAIEKADTKHSFGGQLAIAVEATFRTVDPDELTVVHTHPGAGSWKVSVAQPVRVVFSHPIDTSSVTYGGSFVVEDVTDVANPVEVEPDDSGLVWSADDKIVTFTPAAAYGYTRNLRVTVTQAVRTPIATPSGGFLQTEVTIPFATIDPPPLALVNAVPGADVTAAPRETSPNSGIAAPIVLTFSEGVQQSLIDTNGDGILDGEDEGVILVEDVSEDLAEPVVVPCHIEWLNLDGEPASDAPPADQPYESYLVGKDVTLVLTPVEIPDYSRLLRVTIVGDSDPAEYPLSDVVLSDRATNRGGQLPDTIVYRFRVQDPPALGVVSVVSGSGHLPLRRQIEGVSDSIVIEFTEGVHRSGEDDLAALGLVTFEDVTGLSDPLSDPAHESIAGSFAWNAADAPPGTDLIGEDNELVFTPDAPLGYGTRIRVTLHGAPAPSLTGLRSDRATFRDGQLPEVKKYLFDVETIPDLTVLTTQPGDGVAGVGLNPLVTVRFSEAVACESLDLTPESGSFLVFFAATDPETPEAPVAGGFDPACEEGDTVVTFVPAPDLKYSRDVQVALSEAVMSVRARDINPHYDPLQGHLRGAYEFGFSTLDPPPLAVQSVKGAAGSVSLLRDVDGDPATVDPESIVIRFSEGVCRYTDEETGEIDPAAILERLLIEDITGLDEAALAAGESHGVVEGSFAWNAGDLDWADENALIGADDTVVFTSATWWQWGMRVRVTLKGAQDNPVWLESDRATARGGQLPMDESHYFRVETLPDLTLVKATPSAEAQNIPIDQSIELVFSEGVDCASVEEGLLVSFAATDPEAPGTPVHGALTCTDAEETVVFTPTEHIKYSRDVVVELTDEVRSFRAADDPAHPEADPLQGHLRHGWAGGYSTVNPPLLGVVSVSSESGESLLLRGDAIVAVFTEGVAQASASLGETVVIEDVTGLESPLTDPSHGSIAGSLEWNSDDAPVGDDLIGDDDVLRFVPDELLPYGTWLRVTLKGSPDSADPGLHSDRATVRGGQLPRDVVLIFRVERLPELFVRGTSPGHLSTEVSQMTQSISVTFSAAPSCATITSDNLVVSYDTGVFTEDPLDPSGTTIAGSWSCEDGSATVVFTATEPFGWGRYILVSLGEEIRDVRAEDGAANANDADQGHLIPAYQFGFSTERIRLLQIISTNAAGSVSFERIRRIVVAFDREVDCARITPETFFVNRGLEADYEGRLEAEVFCDGDTAATVEIAAVDDTEEDRCDGIGLCYDTEYTFVLAGGSEGICVPEKDERDVTDDGCLPSPEVTFNFRTEGRPELTATLYPAANTEGVSTLIQPYVTFSNSIRQATVEEDIPPTNPLYPEPDGVEPNICLIEGRDLTDCSLPEAVDVEYVFSDADRVVTLQPLESLNPDTWYTFVVSRDIEDVNGMRLLSFYSSSFKTTPGGLLGDLTVHNREDVNDLYLRARFTDEVDVSLVNENTFYLTYEDELGATRLIPATVSVGSQDPAQECDPSETGSLHCDAATLVPDLMALFTCGSLTAELVGTDGALTSGTRNFATASYVFTANDVGKYVFLASDSYAANNGSFRIDDVSGGLAVLAGSGFATEENLSWSLTLTSNALPLNTVFTAHLSTAITSADGTENVWPSAGDRQYLMNFTTGGDTLVAGVSYTNPLLGPNKLGGADEVPVNSWFDVALTGAVDAASVSEATVYLADGRGADGRVIEGTAQFEVDAPGIFSAPRDLGKRIAISGSQHGNDGEYQIVTVVDDRTVTLAGGGLFAAAEGDLFWERRLSESVHYELEVTSGGRGVRVRPLMLLNRHADYRGRYAAVTAGGDTVAVSLANSNFRFREDRDLGRIITLTGVPLASNRAARIVAVDEGANSVTVDGPAFDASGTNLSWSLSDDRDYHELVLVGRSVSSPADYLRDTLGNPLAGNRRFRFVTSPETLVVVVPLGGLQTLMNPGVLFSRTVRFDSVTNETAYFMQGTTKVEALPSFIVSRPDTVTLFPVPALRDGINARVNITSDVIDFRGNPVNATEHNLGIVGGAPASAAIAPDRAPSVTPGGGSIAGKESFRLVWTDAGNNRTRMMPNSINHESVRLLQEVSTGGGGSVSAGSDIFSVTAANPFQVGRDEGRLLRVTVSGQGQNGYYVIEAVLSSSAVRLAAEFASSETGLGWELLVPIRYGVDYFADAGGGTSVDLIPVDRMLAGKPTRLIVDTTKITNMYTFAYTVTNTYSYTVETTAPTLEGVYGDALADAMVSLDGRTDVLPKTALTLLFSEGIAEESVTAASITLEDNDGEHVRGTFEVENNRVVFTPAAPLLSPLSPYTLTATTAVTDAAGNPMAAAAMTSFSIDSTAPSVLMTMPSDGASGVSVGAVITVEFDKAMEPLSLFGSTVWREGTFTVGYEPPLECNANVRDELFGCVSLDARGRRMTFVPQHPNHLIDEMVFTGTVREFVTDLGGNPLPGGDYIFDFDTVGGDSYGPVALCAAVPLTVADHTVDIHLNEPVDPASLHSDTLWVYEVEDGTRVPGVVSLEGGGTIVRFTADDDFTPDVFYGAILFADLADLDGDAQYEPLHVFFEVAP